MANRGFFDGLAAGCLVAAGVTLVGCVFAAILLPSRPRAEDVASGEDDEPDAVPLIEPVEALR